MISRTSGEYEPVLFWMTASDADDLKAGLIPLERMGDLAVARKLLAQK